MNVRIKFYVKHFQALLAVVCYVFTVTNMSEELYPALLHAQLTYFTFNNLLFGRQQFNTGVIFASAAQTRTDALDSDHLL